MPIVTYFCEVEAQALLDLFTPAVVADLATQSARVSLGILDLSAERAEVVQRLAQKAIPVTAWLLLPKEQGYWFNAHNAAQALARYQEFRAWAQAHQLSFDRVGLDIEPDIQDFARLRRRPMQAAGVLLQRLFSFGSARRARRAYADLVERIRADGYGVESYQFPLIAEERLAHSNLLQRLAGLVDVRTDLEVWMLYSSFVRPRGADILASYAPQAQAVAVGVTGGGVQAEGLPRQTPLNWDELARDLRLAYSSVNQIYIFSLEGCVQQGCLSWLNDFTWDQPILLPEAGKVEMDAWRGTIVSGLWLASRLPYFALGALLLWKLLRRWKKAR